MAELRFFFNNSPSKKIRDINYVVYVLVLNLICTQLYVFNISQVVMVMKAIAACGSTPENVAKVIMVENQLSKKGAQSRFISDALKHLADYEKDREKVISALRAAFSEDKLNRDDVFLSVRMAQAIENENEPTWKDVKNMKELIAGCSVSSPEGIELNLARATKVWSLINLWSCLTCDSERQKMLSD